MVYKKIIIFSAILFMPFFAVASDLFFDGFESDDFTKWTLLGPNWVTVTNASGAHSGSNRAEVKGQLVNSVLYKEISTSGYENISLNYWYKIGKGLEDDDHVIVEWSLDGSSWDQLEDFTNVSEGDWSQKSYSLPATVFNNSNFKFRFRATLGAATSDIFRLDDVYLKGDAMSVATPPPAPEPVTPSPEPQLEANQPLAETPIQESTTVQLVSEPTPQSTPEPAISVNIQPEPEIVAAPPIPKKQKTQVVVKKESPKKAVVETKPLEAKAEQSLPEPKNPYFNYLIYALTIGVVSVIVVLKLMKFLI